MHPAVAISAVLFGCCSNAVFLELCTRLDPGSGILFTFVQFLLISVEGFIFTSQWGTKKRIIPLKHYFMLVLLFFVANVANNWALKFNISVPLHMIFRSGSLITNMILGIIILHRSYTLIKYSSVLMITVGICICTLVSGSHEKHAMASDTANDGGFFMMLIGIFILSVGLLVSSRLGIYQETLFTTYGKHPKEALYYSHLLPLPGFLLLYKDLYEHATIASNSDAVVVPVLGLAIPILWLYILGNAITQYACISSVYSLQTECTSLTVTLVVTLRKFVSLLFSIFYFNNPFTLYHWLGTTLVFVGTLLFVDIAKIIQDLIKPKGSPAIKRGVKKEN